MITTDQVFQIGRLTRTHGIHGEMELQFTDDAFDRGEAEYVVLLIDGIFVPFFFESYRFKNNEAALIQFVDIKSEREARRLVGLPVYYAHDALPEDEEPELRSLQGIVGFTVLLPDLAATTDETQLATRELGEVAQVIPQGDSTLFIVNTDEGEVYIPYHDDFLLDYNLRARYLVLQLPEGVLELND